MAAVVLHRAESDPRHPGAHPELRTRVIVPDVLLQSHSASLEMMFYGGRQFPRQYVATPSRPNTDLGIGSAAPAYKVIRVPVRRGVPTGEYEDFMTGFVTPAGEVWGRPVGVAEAKDGALFVSDDGSNTIWRVTYTGK